MTTYDLTFNGVDALTIGGTTSSWNNGSLGWFSYTSLGSRYIKLSASSLQWNIGTLNISGSGKLYIYDNQTSTSSYGTINGLNLGGSSSTNTVSLTYSHINYYLGGSSSDILNFATSSQYINTSSGDDTVTLDMMDDLPTSQTWVMFGGWRTS